LTTSLNIVSLLKIVEAVLLDIKVLRKVSDSGRKRLLHGATGAVDGVGELSKLLAKLSAFLVDIKDLEPTRGWGASGNCGC